MSDGTTDAMSDDTSTTHGGDGERRPRAGAACPSGSRTRACPSTGTGWPTSTRRRRSGPSARSPTLFGLSDARHARASLVAYFAIRSTPTAASSESVGGPAPPTSLLGLGLGVGAARHRRRRDPLGQDAHAGRRAWSRSGTRCAAADGRARRGGRRSSTEGGEESGLGRRPLIRNTLIGALALVPLPLVVLLRDLGPLPGDDAVGTTMLEGQGTRIVRDPERHARSRPADVAIGSVVARRAGELAIEEADGTSSRSRPRPRSILRAAGPGRHRRPAGARTGATRASSPTPRSAPTWAARSRCTSSRRTTCCARATSRPSTSPTTAR